LFVYRIEDPTSGWGPYTAHSRHRNKSSYEVVRDHLMNEYAIRGYSKGTNPPPWNDGLGDIYDTEFTGFRSLKQLREWFSTDDLKTIAGAGFVARRYQIDGGHVRKGRHQLVFERDKAIVSKTLDFQDILGVRRKKDTK
jgi:hypothetical protein